MTALHIVNKPSPGSDALARCLAFINSGDALLLIEDAVYNGTDPVWPSLRVIRDDIGLYALAPDLEARGLGERMAKVFVRVDYDGFVTLATAHAPVITWC